MLNAAPVAAVIAVKDLDGAKQFYGDKLGLKVTMDNSPDAVVYEAGGGTAILVYARPNHEPSAATIAAFNVSDLAAETADLKGRGISFENYDIPGVHTDADGVATMPDGTKSAWFKDPEGNIIAVGQM